MQYSLDQQLESKGTANMKARTHRVSSNNLGHSGFGHLIDKIAGVQRENFMCKRLIIIWVLILCCFIGKEAL